MISEKSDEIEKMQQLTMLREKRDQLMHWVAENGGKEKYSQELEETTKELENLKSDFKPKQSSHYQKIRESIQEHKKARSYWMSKLKETKT